MNITQVTTFPTTLGLLGGNQITATGTTGAELKNSLLTQLTQKQAQGQAGAQAATDAINAVNT